MKCGHSFRNYPRCIKMMRRCKNIFPFVHCCYWMCEDDRRWWVIFWQTALQSAPHLRSSVPAEKTCQSSWQYPHHRCCNNALSFSASRVPTAFGAWTHFLRSPPSISGQRYDGTDESTFFDPSAVIVVRNRKTQSIFRQHSSVFITE